MDQENKFQRQDVNYEDIKAKLLGCEDVKVGEVPLDKFKDTQKWQKQRFEQLHTFVDYSINYLGKYAQSYGELSNSLNSVKERQNQLTSMIDDLYKTQNQVKQMIQAVNRNQQENKSDHGGDGNQAGANQFIRKLQAIQNIKQRLKQQVQQRENHTNVVITLAIMKNVSKDSKAKGKKAIEFHEAVYSALVSLLKNRVVADKAQVGAALKNPQSARFCMLRLKSKLLKGTVLTNIENIVNEQGKADEQVKPLMDYMSLILKEANIIEELNVAERAIQGRIQQQNNAQGRATANYDKNELTNFQLKIQENIQVLEEIRARLVEFYKLVLDDMQLIDFKVPQYRQEANRYFVDHNQSQDIKKAPTIKPAIEIPLNGSTSKRSQANFLEAVEVKQDTQQQKPQQRAVSPQKFQFPPPIELEGEKATKGRGGFCGCFG